MANATKIAGAEKIRRTCFVQGRNDEQGNPISHSLIRQNVNVSKVLPVGQTGEPEDVPTNQIYDVRIAPRPPRTQPRADTKEYPADKQPRRLCFVEGRGDQKYHLLRKGAEMSKVLKLGVAGTGEWIATTQIKDEHMVPVPVKARHVERKPVRIATLKGDPGQEYVVLRKTVKGARIIPVYNGDYGRTVDPSELENERTINQAAKKNQDEKTLEGGEQAPDGSQLVDAGQGGEQVQENLTTTTAAPEVQATTPPDPSPVPPTQVAPVPTAPVAVSPVSAPQARPAAAPGQTAPAVPAAGAPVAPSRPAPAVAPRPAPAAPVAAPAAARPAPAAAPRPQPVARPQGR